MMIGWHLNEYLSERTLYYAAYKPFTMLHFQMILHVMVIACFFFKAIRNIEWEGEKLVARRNQ